MTSKRNVKGNGLVVLAAVLTGAMFPALCQAAMTPISLTGWTQDVIAERTAASPFAGTTVDYSGGSNSHVWYETGAPNSTQGLPSSGAFTSAFNANTSFQFQPYNGNNVLLNNGTLVLAVPGSFESLAFLVSAQGIPGVQWRALLNFSDSSQTDTGPFSVNDWTLNGNNALNNMGVLPRSAAWSGFYAGSLHMFEQDFTLSAADQLKTLSSITFVKNSGNIINYFAVSGSAVFIPEPATATLGLIGLALLARRRQRTA